MIMTGRLKLAEHVEVSVKRGGDVMTTLRKVTDFIFLLPFLFSLYHYPEPSGTFYNNPPTSVLTHTLDHSSMTQYDVA